MNYLDEGPAVANVDAAGFQPLSFGRRYTCRDLVPSPHSSTQKRHQHKPIYHCTGASELSCRQVARNIHTNASIKIKKM